MDEKRMQEIYEQALSLVEESEAPEDHRKAVELLRPLAEANYPDALELLGFCLFRGIGTEVNKVQAGELFHKAADLGNMLAFADLGNWYREQGDMQKAADYYARGAEAGDPEAQKYLGEVYFLGEGVEEDKQKAVSWFRKAAAREEASAQYHLYHCCFNGWGTEKNKREALDWLKKAAENGFPDAQSDLGERFFDGDGVPQDRRKGLELLENAVAAGDVEAMTNLGLRYLRADGVELDEEKGFSLTRKAAQEGYANAQYNLYLCLHRGVGCSKDEHTAIYWLEKAAEKGVPEAQFILSRRCRTENDLVKTDEMKARRMEAEAEKTEDLDAMRNIANLCWDGDYPWIKKDPEEAVKWLRRLCRKSDQGEDHFRLYELLRDEDSPCYDPDGAFQAVQRAAELGCAPALPGLANCYSCGIGTNRDPGKARQILEEAGIDPEEGPDSGQNREETEEEIIRRLAERAESSGRGEDYFRYMAKIAVWQSPYYDAENTFLAASRAVELGEERALPFLAECYGQGLGTKKDLRKARKLLARARNSAADSHFTQATENLIEHYAKLSVNEKKALFRQISSENRNTFEAGFLLLVLAWNGDGQARKELIKAYENGLYGLPRSQKQAAYWRGKKTGGGKGFLIAGAILILLLALIPVINSCGERPVSPPPAPMSDPTEVPTWEPLEVPSVQPTENAAEEAGLQEDAAPPAAETVIAADNGGMWLADLPWFTYETVDNYAANSFHEVNTTYYDPRDNLGQEHQRVLMTGGSYQYSQTYLLDGAYAGLSGSFYLRYDERDCKAKATLTLYGDGRQLWSCADMSTGIRPVSFDVDLRGVDELSLELICDQYQASSFALGDAWLYTEPVQAAQTTETPAQTLAPTAAPTPVQTAAPASGRGYAVGSVITMGSFEQDGESLNGKEPMEWLVLAQEGDRALLISRYALTTRAFDGSTWEQSSLRSWLNEDFLKWSFTDEEKQRILETDLSADRNPSFSTDPGKATRDRIFLLSLAEYEKYFPGNSGACEATTDCARYAYCSKEGSGRLCYWMLRTPGCDSDCIMLVSPRGEPFGGYVKQENDSAYYSWQMLISVQNGSLAVRPAMWISLG